jgi:hypothetical protein
MVFRLTFNFASIRNINSKRLILIFRNVNVHDRKIVALYAYVEKRAHVENRWCQTPGSTLFGVWRRVWQ